MSASRKEDDATALAPALLRLHVVGLVPNSNQPLGTIEIASNVKTVSIEIT